jgi:DnaJ-class molecular chaperone
MSKKKTVIELSAAKIAVTGPVEGIYSSGHECGNCHGNGWVRHALRGDDIEEDCPVCGGSGLLDALVTIQWLASGKKKR